MHGSRKRENIQPFANQLADFWRRGERALMVGSWGLPGSASEASVYQLKVTPFPLCRIHALAEHNIHNIYHPRCRENQEHI